jgi:putative acetyltransferase
MTLLYGNLDNPQVRGLLDLHFRNMHEISPPGTAYVLDLSALTRSDISFITLWDRYTLLACGALKETSRHTGEIKSMRTHPDHLGKGAATQILEEIIRLARERAYTGLSLETGTSEPFESAIRLYKRYGFRSGEAFGDYIPSEFNQFFHIDL